MKITKIIAAVALLAAFSGARAQSEGWSTLWLELNPMEVNVDAKGAHDMDLTGLGVGYSRAFGLTQSVPLYLEPGVALQWAFGDEKHWFGQKNEWDIISLKIPVNLLYRIDIPRSTVKIVPFGGLTFRFNLYGKGKCGGKYDLFDDDPGDFDAKRFQLGWQVGCKAQFAERFTAGLSWGTDLMEFKDDMVISTGSVFFGWTF